MRKHLFVWCSLVFFGYNIQAQNSTSEDSLREKISVLARNNNDSVVLRWAPDNFITWKYLNETGYDVIRVDISEAKSKYEQVKLNTSPIKPWTIDEWKTRFPKDHAYAPIALQAVYGKEFIQEKNSPTPNLATMKNLSQEQEMRWTFSLFSADMDAMTAQALGLRWVDKTVLKDRIYVYYVMPVNKELKIDTGFVSVNTAEADFMPELKSPEFDEEEKMVTLFWDNTLFANFYSGYNIERSEDGKTWKKLNRMPVIKVNTPDGGENQTLIYSDTTIKTNYKPYKYRVIGITPFGETDSPSPIITAMGRDKTPPPPPEIIEAKADGDFLKVKWKYDSKSMPNDFKGFHVVKALKLNEPFTPVNKDVLKPDTREFIDKESIGFEGYYYKVYAVDTAGNFSSTFPLFNQRTDSIPPVKPNGLTGKIDTNGVVTLEWPLGKEKDILGYRVFFSNALDHEFTNITPYPVRDTIYKDTISLKTLTKKIFYRIVAVDVNFNHSDFSKILELKRPDTIAPNAPIFSNYLVSDSSVTLEFVQSTATDIANYNIYRKDNSLNEWQLIKTFKQPVNTTTYIDTKVKGPEYYQYEIEAVDSAGNKSQKSPTVEVRVYSKLIKEELRNVKATYDSEKKIVKLNWDKPENKINYYVIYRSVNGQKSIVLSSPNGSALSYTDNELFNEGTFNYFIKAVFVAGNETPLAKSNQVIVKTN